jgi:antitoxin HicB
LLIGPRILSGAGALRCILSTCSDWYYRNRMRYLVYLQQDEDGIFVATCPSLPGCGSQGATRSEAQANIREPVELYLKGLRKHGEPIPPGIEEGVIQVAG